MNTPAGETGRILERIMKDLKPHLKEDDSGSPIHYNRAWEIIRGGLESFGYQVTERNARLRGTD